MKPAKSCNVKVVLDRDQFGSIAKDESLPKYAFFLVVDEKREYITTRHCDGTILIAVDSEQYKRWKKQKIISELVNEE